MASYQLLEAVRDDLDGIWKYIAGATNPALATRVEDEFFEAFALLATQPQMGFRQPKLTDRPIRFWVLYRYLIAYAPDHQPLLILGVIHGHMHPHTITSILAGRH